MIRNVKRAWFEVWGTEEAQNRFLKVLLGYFFALSCVLSIVVLVLSLRKPPVIAVSSTESRILTITPPPADLLEAEVRRAVQGYVSAHHNWEWGKIDEAFQAASRFVHPDFTKKFLAANEAQARVAKEKRVSQRFYVSSARFDQKAKTGTVSGDRILLVEGLRAANPLTLEIEYDFGPRTEANPEGVYITGEKLLSGGEGSTR